MKILRRARINLGALCANFRRVKALAPEANVLAMVKANAYGHGLVPVARRLVDAGVDALGVADIRAALTLREASIAQRIVLMAGFMSADELALLAHHRIDSVVHSDFQLVLLEQANLPLSVWLKVDTGMNRLGFTVQEALPAYNRLIALPTLQKPIPLMTHFSCADEPSKQAITSKQHANFTALVTRIRDVAGTPVIPQSIAHSAGILMGANKHVSPASSWVRPGIMLYGISPTQGRTGLEHSLQPVMTLLSELIAVRHIKRGDTVGYGAIWRSPCDKRIGIVGIGYGDGYPRVVPNGTPVLVEGIECPIVGRVSMDMLAVDLTRCLQAQIGSPVVLWGEGLPVERIAQAAGTISYELLSGLTQRVQYEFIGI